MDESRNKTEFISVRVTVSEKASIRAKAKALGVSESTFARLLLSLPVESVERLVEGGIVFVDRSSCARVARQARAVGNLYNQAVRALNAIAAKRFMTEEHTIEYIDQAKSLLWEASRRLDVVERDMESMLSALISEG